MKNISERVTKDILNGTDSKLLQTLRRDPWANPKMGLELAAGLWEALENPKPLTRTQRKLLDRCRERLRETVVRIDPPTMLLIAISRYQLLREHTRQPNPFFTRPDETVRAVKIIKTLLEARRSLRPYREPEGLDQETEANALIGLGVLLYDTIFCSVAEHEHTWTSFLTAVVQDNADAIATLGMLVEAESDHNNVGIIPFSQFVEFAEEESPKLMDALVSEGQQYPVYLPVPDKIHDTVSETYTRFLHQHQLCQIAYEQALERFRQYPEEFAYLEKVMWEDIVSNPRYGLRNHGLDKIRLDFGSCPHRVVPEMIQLFPLAFPKAQAKCWMRYRGERHSVATYNLGPEPADGYMLAGRFLRFVAIQCYWEITMGRAHQDLASTSSETKERRLTADREQLKNKLSHVRPFFRKLPIGYRSSRKALTLAQQTFAIGSMPSGKTFVQEHERGWQEMEAIAPLFTYSCRDIESWF